VIVLLTKADAMEGMAIGRLRDEGMQMKDAMEMAGDLGKQILSEVSTKIKIQLNGCKYPPKDYLLLHGKVYRLDLSCKYANGAALWRYEQRRCRL